VHSGGDKRCEAGVSRAARAKPDARHATGSGTTHTASRHRHAHHDGLHAAAVQPKLDAPVVQQVELEVAASPVCDV
jgi:hypothetical protein